MRTLVLAISLVLVVVGLAPAAASGQEQNIVIPLRGTATTTTVVDLATGKGTADGTFHYSGISGNVHVDITSFRLHGNRFAFAGKETDVIGNLGKIFGMDRGWGMLTSTGPKVTIVDRIVGGTGLFACARGVNVIRGKGTILSVVGSTITMRFNSTAVGRVIIRPSC